MQDFFSYYICQQTILADVSDGCQSNGRRVSSIFDLLAPAAKAAPAGPPAPSSPRSVVLPRRSHRPYYSHRWPGHPSTHPHPSTDVASPPMGHSLLGSRHRPSRATPPATVQHPSTGIPPPSTVHPIDRLQLAAVAKESLDRVQLTAIDRLLGFSNA